MVVLSGEVRLLGLVRNEEERKEWEKEEREKECFTLSQLLSDFCKDRSPKYNDSNLNT